MSQIQRKQGSNHSYIEISHKLVAEVRLPSGRQTNLNESMDYGTIL